MNTPTHLPRVAQALPTSLAKSWTTVVASTALSALATLGLLALSPAAQADTQTRTTSYEYDAAGLLSKTIIEPTRPNDCLQAVYAKDSFGNATTTTLSTCAGAVAPATTSAGTRASSNTYGTDGRFVLSSSNAASQSETKTYDPRNGRLLSLTGPNGLTTSWQYDNFARKTRETRSDATYSTWTYALCTDAGANCPAPIAGAASTWVAIEQSFAVNAAINAPEQRSYFDAFNRVLRSQTQGFDGAGAAPTLVQDTEYNALGQVARQSNRYALSGGTPVWSSSTYDALGRPISQSVPDPAAPGSLATTTFAYSALVTSSTNAKTQTKTSTKSARGQITSVVDAQGSSISYSFDAQGNLLSTNAAGSITSMAYDLRGNKTSMLDPAMGSWTYSYNAYGELVSQRDSLSKTVSIAYDTLGRMTQRSEPDLVSQWSYDKKFDGTSCGKGIGKLCQAKADNGYQRSHSFDALGRQIQTTTILDNPSVPAVVSESFDANTGRVTSKTWPTGYQASYGYSALGYLKSVTGGGTNGFAQTVSYQIQAINANGQITQYRTGNTVTAVNSFDPLTQRLTGLTATADGQASGNVIKQSYGYDSLGNLTSRSDTSPNVGTQESYSYDSLNRLTTATLLGGAVSPPTTTEVKYDARGNISYKSDVGRYWYDSARPNRMTAVTLESAPGAIQSVTGSRTLSYAFDDLKSGAQMVNGIQVGNGNLEYTVSHDTVKNVHTVRAESYTSFNQPNAITYGNFITNTTSTQDRKLSYVYGPEHQRVKENVTLSGNGTSSYFAGNTWYLNGADGLGLSFEKEIRANGTIENKHYVSAAGTVFALFTSRTGTLNGLPATSTSYFHKDHLGSIAAITNEVGVITERLAYDPWGKRRFINTTPGLPDSLDAIVGQKTDRGYTEHQHLDEIGVIHMNGRIYDPLIGRFMSADPIIQAPLNLKSFNRYAYVWNNPLNSTDPTGFAAKKPAKAPFAWRSDPPALGSGTTLETVRFSYKREGPAASWTLSNELWRTPDDGRRLRENQGRDPIAPVAPIATPPLRLPLPPVIIVAPPMVIPPPLSIGTLPKLDVPVPLQIAVALVTVIIKAAPDSWRDIKDAFLGTPADLSNPTLALAVTPAADEPQPTAAPPEGTPQDKLPEGSKGINQTEWSGDHGEIKKQLGVGPKGNVFIDPNNNVWVQTPSGQYVNEGPAGSYTGSGESSGRRGRDRGKR